MTRVDQSTRILPNPVSPAGATRPAGPDETPTASPAAPAAVVAAPDDRYQAGTSAPANPEPPSLSDMPEPELRPVQRLNTRLSAAVIANANFVRIGNTSVLLDLRRVSLGNPILLNDLGRGLTKLEQPGQTQSALDFSVKSQSLVDSVRHGSQAAAPLPIDAALIKGTPHQHDSLEQALADAKKQPGTQVVMPMCDAQGQQSFYVANLKPGVNPATLTPQSGTVLIAGPDHKIQLISQGDSPERSQDLAKALVDMIQDDRTAGFDRSKAGTQETSKMPVYQHNLNQALAFLTTLPDNTTNRALRAVLVSKLQLLPVGKAQIPGTDQTVGAYRKDYSQAVSGLEKALADYTASPAADPEVVTLLQQEISTAITTGMRIEGANTAIKMRVGALATIFETLAQTPEQLNQRVNQYMLLKGNIDPNLPYRDQAFAKDDKFMRKALDTEGLFGRGGMFKHLATQADAVNNGRDLLVQTLLVQREVFARYAPREGGEITSGAQKTLDLIDHQISELQQNPADDTEMLKIMHSARSELLKAVSQAGSQWAGISPKEAGILANIDKGLQTYLADYDVILDQFDALDAELEDKRMLLLHPPESTVTPGKLNKFQNAYIKEVQRILAVAPRDSKLEKLKLLLQSLQVLSSPDTLKKTADLAVPVEEVKRRINELWQDPQVAGYFEGIQRLTMRKTFGDEGVLIKEQTDFLLSRDFKDYRDVLPPAERKQVLERELRVLASFNKQAAQEVALELAGAEILNYSPQVLASLSPEARKNAVSEGLKGIDEAYSTTLGKPVSVAGAIGDAMGLLTPDEMRLAGHPDQLFDTLIKKLDKHPHGAAAVNYLKDIKDSGHFGAFTAAVGVIGLGGKFPPEDFKGTLDFTGSAAGLLASGKDVYKVFGPGKVGMTNLLDSAAKLGPVGEVLGMVVGGVDSFVDFHDGDTFGGAMKAGGVASSGVGLLVSAGLMGGPVLLIGATVAGGAFWLADTLGGESDQETIFRRAGILKTQQ